MKTVMLSLVIALCATLVASAQDTVTVNSGSMFFIGNDLGNPPFTLSIADDSLRINGYAVGMRKSQAWDEADRNPGKPDSLDAAAYSYAAALRAQPSMTQGKLIKEMAAFYSRSPTVKSATIDENTVVVQYRRFNLPINYPFQLVVIPHRWPTTEEKLDALRARMREFADVLNSGGLVCIGDGGKSFTLPNSQADLTERLRAVAHQSASAINELARGCRLPPWLAEELNSPRALPSK